MINWTPFYVSVIVAGTYILLMWRLYRSQQLTSNRYRVAGQVFRDEMRQVLAAPQKEQSHLMVRAIDRNMRILTMNRQDLKLLEEDLNRK